jgi:hypothetical protein
VNSKASEPIRIHMRWYANLCAGTLQPLRRAQAFLARYTHDTRRPRSHTRMIVGHTAWDATSPPPHSAT